ncbi:hypothetical protein DFH27DRAFT_569176 [Peziza echinospora]|nr:hypothetical protein DFH27DRAFT_569176 [Peziza echinospora]
MVSSELWLILLFQRFNVSVGFTFSLIPLYTYRYYTILAGGFLWLSAPQLAERCVCTSGAAMKLKLGIFAGTEPPAVLQNDHELSNRCAWLFETFD